MHVIVLGAGIIGVSTAWYLLEHGHTVTVVDRQGHAALETSFGNGAQISVCFCEPWANAGAPLKVAKWLLQDDAPLLFRPRLDPAQWRWGLSFLTQCSDAAFARNVTALERVQPPDLAPSQITARLGAPWLPATMIEQFVEQLLGIAIRIRHVARIASWSFDLHAFEHQGSATSDWGTSRRHAGLLLEDALNARIPQIWDVWLEDGVERRALNSEATEAAKEKLARLKAAFEAWIWTDPERADELARIYNQKFNNLVPRHFDGSHLQLPGASQVIRFYPHQKRVVWRIISAGSTYIAHAVGAGKTFSIAAAIMEQKRLGLITKAMLVVPGHCLAQASREFLQLYPTASILVADESNFVAKKRLRFLARAATSGWDCIILTHSAFKLIPSPAAFECQLIQAHLASYV